ncbi:hypothetical protein J7K86_02765 [bacterium]|nr:hypothetical protein [bacterium]
MNLLRKKKILLLLVSVLLFLIIGIVVNKKNKINFKFHKTSRIKLASTTTVILHLEVKPGILSGNLSFRKKLLPDKETWQSGNLKEQKFLDIFVRDHRAILTGWHAILCAQMVSSNKPVSLSLSDVKIIPIGRSSIEKLSKSISKENIGPNCVSIVSVPFGYGRGNFLLQPVLNIHFIPEENNQIIFSLILI